jgi:CRP/FNR family transcriptional regulator
VKLSLAASNGAAKIVRLVSASSSPCEILDKAALERPVHSVTCETLTRVQIACLEKPAFSRLVRQEPSFASLVVSALSNEVDWHVQTLRDNLAAHARERLAKTLLMLADTHGKRTRHGTEIALPIRRHELASALGFSRETISRLLGDLGREGILALTRRSICIISLSHLKRLAGR